MPLTPDHIEPGRRPGSIPSLVVSLIAVFAFGMLALPAGGTAAVPEQASFSMTLGTGNAGKALKRSGVRYSAVKPSKQKRLSAKRVQITSTLKASRVGGEVLGLRGGIKFSKGKRKLAFRQIEVRTTTTPMQIWGTAKGKSIKLFTTKVNADVDTVARRVDYKPSPLKLSGRSAKMIKSKLRLKRLPAAKAGSLSDGFYSSQIEDPYLDLCNLPATSFSMPSFPEAVPPPVLGDAVTTVGDPIEWGFKTSFNGYVNGIGSIGVLDGATKIPFPGPPNPAAPPWKFGFVFQQGEYDANGAEAADDQAVLNGAGSVMYCNEPHGFRITISDPTVVIDGDSSRVIATVNTNISGDLAPAKRAHIADLDLSAAVIDDSVPGEVKWTFPAAQGPPATSTVTLSEDGSEALRLCDVNVPGAPPGCLYPPGTLLDGLTVTADFALG